MGRTAVRWARDLCAAGCAPSGRRFVYLLGMHRDAAPLLRTLERKQAYVLGVDDVTFVPEVRSFVRWALADLTLRTHLKEMIEPPPEVTSFVEAAPRLVGEAG